MKRAEWIDSCRFFAIFLIMLTHFIDKLVPSLLLLWETPPSSWLLYGLTGKFSVAFFFVILGYFASKPVKFNASDFIKYSVRRYLNFAFYIFFCTLIYILACYGTTWIFHSPDINAFRVISDGFSYNIIYLMRDSFLFEDNYNATLWCMQQLFIASIFCKLLAYIPEKLPPIIRCCIPNCLIGILMLINAEFFVWICAAILGCILSILQQRINECHRKPTNSFFILLFFAALILIKIRLDEGVLQYSLQAIAAFLLIFIQFNYPAIKKLLSTAPFPWLGGISMGLFVCHTPVYSILHSSVYVVLSKFLPHTAAILIYFICSVIISIFSAWILKRLYESLAKLFAKAIVQV